MFTRGGSAPGGVATHMLARQSHCHRPAHACAAHGHTHPQTCPHTNVSPRAHIALTPVPGCPLVPGLQPPCLHPQKASDIWAHTAQRRVSAAKEVCRESQGVYDGS